MPGPNRVLCSAATVIAASAALWLSGCSSSSTSTGVPGLSAVPGSFAQLADEAYAAVVSPAWSTFSNGWHYCPNYPTCGTMVGDWGADSMTNIMYERWLITKDPVIANALLNFETQRRNLDAFSFRAHGSDVGMWDAVAKMRVYAATHDLPALQNAETSYDGVTSLPFARGHCPGIMLQLIDSNNSPSGGGLKTLETDSNRVLAAALFAENETDGSLRQKYLADATATYAAIRASYFDPAFALYTVYVLDNGTSCTQIPQRFFASVNGVMIEAGMELASLTGDSRYMDDALATAHAIGRLADDRGIFTDLQAENDIVEPLVGAMLKLALAGNGEARTWIVQNAGAAVTARTTDGLAYGRFFDGPAPSPATHPTIFQSNGGFALMIAAAALAPMQVPATANVWVSASPQMTTISAIPTTLPFTGSGIALFGTMGEDCASGTHGSFPGDICENGHVRVLIDGKQMVDLTGIWQRKAITPALPDTLLFAWRWPASGPHKLDFQFQPGDSNPKEGDAFIHVQRELIVP